MYKLDKEKLPFFSLHMIVFLLSITIIVHNSHKYK